MHPFFHLNKKVPTDTRAESVASIRFYASLSSTYGRFRILLLTSSPINTISPTLIFRFSLSVFEPFKKQSYSEQKRLRGSNFNFCRYRNHMLKLPVSMQSHSGTPSLGTSCKNIDGIKAFKSEGSSERLDNGRELISASQSHSIVHISS